MEGGLHVCPKNNKQMQNYAMNLNSYGQSDDINLLKTIRKLCTTKIRHPMTIEQTKAWLNQFSLGPERTLGLLILRYLIYRTAAQLDSSFKQALKAAAMSFVPSGFAVENINWRDVLNGKVAGLDFNYGPPKQGTSRPGKSGELMSRQLKFCDPLSKFKLSYPDAFSFTNANQRYLVIDDGTFTGLQIKEFFMISGAHLAQTNQCGIVVGLAHEDAILEIGNAYPNIPIFYGEKITHQECFKAMCENWIEDGMWPYHEVSPLVLYRELVQRAGFGDNLPLGFGDLGGMVAYEHGIPDNSIQLLWDRSSKWTPLITR